MVRGLRLAAVAGALALSALLVDARLRLPGPDPAHLIAVPPPQAAPAPPAASPEPAVGPGSGMPPPAPAAPASPAEPAAAPERPSVAAPAAAPPSVTVAAPVPAAPPPGDPAAPPASQAAPSPSPGSPRTVRDGVLAYQAGDYERAFAVWRPLAEAGNARAQFHLGALYLEGRLAPPDPEEAYLWLARAAAAGQAAAAPLRDRVAEALPAERLAELEDRLGRR